LELKVLLAHRELLVQQVRRELRESKERKDYKDSKVYRA
jgi:hypothetical protein